MDSINTIIDNEKIIELRNLDSSGDGNFLTEIVDLYLSQLNTLNESIKNSCNKGNFLQASKSAHSLRGASLNIGAIALADISKKIEQDIKDNQILRTRELIAQLEPVSKNTIAALEEIKINEIEI